MDSVDDRHHAIEPVAAVKSVGHRQDDDREQKKQIEEHHAAAGLRRHREPAVMAEPEQSGDDEGDRQRDHRLRIDAHEVDPAGRVLEARGLRQVIGQQRHGNAEDGVAQHFQPAHFEQMRLRQNGSPVAAVYEALEAGDSRKQDYAADCAATMSRRASPAEPAPRANARSGSFQLRAMGAPGRCGRSALVTLSPRRTKPSCANYCLTHRQCSASSFFGSKQTSPHRPGTLGFSHMQVFGFTVPPNGQMTAHTGGRTIRAKETLGIIVEIAKPSIAVLSAKYICLSNSVGCDGPISRQQERSKSENPESVSDIRCRRRLWQLLR